MWVEFVVDDEEFDDVDEVSWDNTDDVAVIDEVLSSRLYELPTSSTILLKIIALAFLILSNSPTMVTHLSASDMSVHF